MKQYMKIVFGGLSLMLVGIVVYSSIHWFVYTGIPLFSKIHIPSLANAISVLTDTDDGTSINGFVRLIRYSASEEEDLLNNANKDINKDKISASAFVIKKYDSNEIIVAQNSEKLLPIASITKLVAAIIARKNILPQEHIILTKKIIDTYGNTAQFKPGETFLAEDLMYPLLMVSSNDAAEAFAYNYGRKQFIKEMNDFVQSIGAYRTYFVDPSGLSPDNRSTAKDIAIIMEWIIRNDPTILVITDKKNANVRNHNWINPTSFLNWSNYIGGKNGYIPEAGQTGVSVFSFGQKKDLYIVVVLQSSARYSDVVNLLARIK